MTTQEKARANYEKLFNSVELKAAAFDKIAEKYYLVNFGSTSKSDFDVLMFSIYLERILDNNQFDFSTYSDYTLSKYLGITQSKISNLKVKKELLYPYENFNWINSFEMISDRAIYEDGKIKLFIPDKNIYNEVKNAIETLGGFVEIQLTSNLLQVRLPYFLDLMMSICDETTRDELRTKLKEKIKESTNDVEFIEKESFGSCLVNCTVQTIIDIIEKCVPVFGGPLKIIATNIYNVIKNGK